MVAREEIADKREEAESDAALPGCGQVCHPDEKCLYPCHCLAYAYFDPIGGIGSLTYYKCSG